MQKRGEIPHPWGGTWKHANPGRQALSGVKSITLAAPRAARWAHKHPLVTAGAMVGAYMAHKMMKQPYRSTEEGENPVEIVKLEGDLATPAQRLAKLRLEKAYDESRIRRDQSGRFASGGRSSIEREKPGIERSSLIAGGIEGWHAALKRIEASSFLLGDNAQGWVMDFDAAINLKKFTKLMEGAYDNRPSRKSQPKDAIRLIDESLGLIRPDDPFGDFHTTIDARAFG